MMIRRATDLRRELWALLDAAAQIRTAVRATQRAIRYREAQGADYAEEVDA